LDSTSDNPYRSPQAALAPSAAPRQSAWQNRLATVGFLLAMLFPIIALGGLGALLMEDDFGVVRWRVHRLIRMVLFRASMASLVALGVSLVSLIYAPRRLAVYGVFIGLLGSSYWLLAMLGIMRK
jgi:hypothetical protein